MKDNQISSDANPDEVEYWNSAAGQKWVDQQEEMASLFVSVRNRILERSKPAPGERVLDIGCGAGVTTHEIASRVGPEGLALGIDISGLLLDRARDRNSRDGLAHEQYLLADAQIHPFTTGDFDLLFSQFGVMFFADPLAAFRNLLLSLRPGGRLAFACWSDISDNPWFTIPRNAAIEQLGTPSPSLPTAPGPFAFADSGRVTTLMEDAGFSSSGCDMEHVDLFFPGQAEDAASLAMNIGPAARIINEFNGRQSDISAINRKITDGFRDYAADGGVRVPAAINFFHATR